MMICSHCKSRDGVTVAHVRACAQQPKSSVAVIERVPVTEPGMYRRGDDVFQVVYNLAQTHLYAKLYVPTYVGGKLHKFEFSYDKGAIFTLSATDRMTVDEVAQLGRQTGFCWVCHRRLTVQKSILAGIGPVCAKKV